ncbi:MAG: hypothetical protein ACFNM7_06320 [Prevotella conceptionensis]|jgi:hypothetical protein
MKKRTYITPLSESINVVAERLMEVASPGVGGGYDPGKPIDGKGSNDFEEEEDIVFGQEDSQPATGFW